MSSRKMMMRQHGEDWEVWTGALALCICFSSFHHSIPTYLPRTTRFPLSCILSTIDLRDILSNIPR
ncbi:hypothetical protein BDW60DRAFT_179796 [Aspergillus nidulans var. acristatus]